MRQHTILLVILTFISGIIIAVKSNITVNVADAGGLETYELPVPTEGTPEDYSATDNLAFIAYLVGHADYFSTDTEGTVDALGGAYKQTVRNTRIVNDGKAFTEAITTSSFVKRYEQKFFYGNEKVLVRTEDSVNGNNITWKNEVTAISNETYQDLYGWYPTSLIGYIVHPESINSAELTKEGNLYTITCDMNINIAPANNQKEMKTYAGSTDYPSFESLNLVFTFDENWILQTVYENAVYNVNIPGLNWMTCTSSLLETFSFSKTDIPDLDFFMANTDKEIGELTKEKTALDYLQQAFGPYINGKKANFIGTTTLNNTEYDANLSLDLAGLNLNNMSVDLGYENNYIKYKNNFIYLNLQGKKYKIDVLEYMKLDDSSLNMSDLADLAALNNVLDTATFTKNNEKVIVNMPIKFKDINIDINFNMTETDSIILDNLSVSINYQNITFDLTLTPTTLDFTYPEISDDYQDITNSKWLVKEIINIMNYETVNILISSSVKLNNINYDILCNIVYQNNKVSGSLTLKNENDEINIDFYYDDFLYIKVNNIYVKVSTEELQELLKDDITTTNNNYTIDFDIISLDNLLEIIINNEKISIKNNSSLEITYKDTLVEISEGNDLPINSIDGDFIEIDGITSLKELVDEIINLSKAENLDLTVKDLNVSVLDEIVNITGDIKINTLKKELYSNLTITGFSTINNISIRYKDDIFYISYANINVCLQYEEFEYLINYINDQEYIDNIEFKNNINTDLIAIIKVLDSIQITDLITLNLNVLNSNYKISLKYNDSLIISAEDLKYDSMTINNLNVNLSKTDEFIVEPLIDCLNYSDLCYIVDYVNAFYKISKEKKIKFNMSTTIYTKNVETYKANATVAINVLDNGYIDLEIDLLVEPTDTSLEKITANGYIDLNLKMINNYIYLTLNGVKMQSSLDNIKNTIGSVCKILGIKNEMLDQLLNLDTTDVTSSGNIDLILNTFMPQDSSSLSINLADYINSIAVDSSDLTLNLNASKLFNVDTITKVIISKVGSDLTSLTFKNLYSTKTDDSNNRIERFDISFTLLDSSDVSITTPTDKDSYNDFSFLDQFINDLYNTANLNTYQLTGSFNIKVISIIEFSETFELRVSLNEDSTLKDLGLYLETPYLATNNAISFNNTKSYLYYKDDMIYMQRATKSTAFSRVNIEYKNMTLDEFMNDLLNNIYWLTNLSSTITSQISGSTTNSSIVTTFEKSFISCGYNNSTYSITLNGENLARTDMLSTISLNVHRTDTGYLDNLSGSLDKLASSVISATFSIDNNIIDPKAPTDDFIPFDISDTSIFN